MKTSSTVMPAGAIFLLEGVGFWYCLPPPKAFRSREKSRTRGSPSRMVSTSIRRFLLGGIVLDYFCFGWTRLLLLHLHLSFDPGWPSSWRLGWSLPGRPGVASVARCPSTSVAVHRVLRPSVSVARCLSASPAAHRCRRSNSAIRRPSFAPLTLLGMLLLWCPLSDRAVFHGGPDNVCVDVLGWPRRHAALRPRRRYTGAVPFGLGGVMSFGFSGGTPVSPHELGYPTPFVRASDVPLRAVVLVPVIFSLGMFVVLCRWWNELLSGARSRGVGFRGFRFGLCNQPSLSFLSFFL